MTLFPKRSARALWEAGDRARDARQWHEARASYAQALKLSPSRYGLWMQYGNVAKETGDLAEAEAAYRTALVIDPRKPQAHLELAHLLKRIGRWRDAVNHFESVQKLDPSIDVAADLTDARAHGGSEASAVVNGFPLDDLDGAMQALGERGRGGSPNLTHFGRRFADYEIALRNVKTLGYALARALGEDLNARKVAQPPALELGSKLCTQADMESDWVAFWASEMKTPVRYHRKLWEFCYLTQALWQAGKLKPGARGLGFGCGNEPLVGAFAKHGARVLATDLPPHEAAPRGWESASADYRAQYAEICPDAALRGNIEFQPLDMRQIPQAMHGQFDFCWSACSLEHLGTIENGLKFIEESLSVLKPGGVAAHTTEFNVDDGQTIDNWGTVLFQRKHFLDLAQRLERRGYRVAKIDFDSGDGFLDGFVDVPPWPSAEQPGLSEPDAHLKLSLDGFVCTSFGITVFAPGG